MKARIGISLLLLFVILLQTSADINTQLVGVKEGDSFDFKITLYGKNIYAHPPFNKNQTLNIKVTGNPNSTDDLPVSITYENGTVEESFVHMKEFGGPFVYTDWEYWSDKSHHWNIVEEVTIIDKDEQFTVQIHENSSTYNLDYVASYRKSDGSLLLYNWTDTSTVSGTPDTQKIIVEQVTSSNKNSSPFALFTPIIAIPILIKKRKR